MDRADWLDVRKHGIGGSDASVIAGLNPWKSPMELYAEKIGDYPEKAQTWAMMRGTALEEPLAQWFMQKTGIKIRRRNAVLAHPDYPFMLANVDRLVVGERTGVEIKTASPFAIEKWRDGNAPIEYVLQCQHYMAVTGYVKWWLVYCIDGHEPDAILLERDEETIATLIQMQNDFWHNHVIPRIPPSPDNTESCKQALSYLYRVTTPGKSIELPDDAYIWIGMVNGNQSKVKELNSEIDFAKNMLRSYMEDNEVGTIGGEVAVTWKQGKKNRTLLIKGGSEE
jgi:putative phage-type endonuclease